MVRLKVIPQDLIDYRKDIFQFQNGVIKSQNLQNTRLQKSYFNSKMVRLKDVPKPSSVFRT